jgi:hypothetical protein
MAGDVDAAERKLAAATELAAQAEDPANRRPWSYWMTREFFRNEEGITCAHLAGVGPAWHTRAVDLLTPAPHTALRAPGAALARLAQPRPRPPWWMRRVPRRPRRSPPSGGPGRHG